MHDGRFVDLPELRGAGEALGQHVNRAPGVVRFSGGRPPMVGEKKRVSIRSGDQSLGNWPNTDCLGFVWSPKIGMTEPTYEYFLHARRIMNILVRIQYSLFHRQQIVLSRFSRTETCAKVSGGVLDRAVLDADRLRTRQTGSRHHQPRGRPGLCRLGFYSLALPRSSPLSRQPGGFIARPDNQFQDSAPSFLSDASHAEDEVPARRRRALLGAISEKKATAIGADGSACRLRARPAQPHPRRREALEHAPRRLRRSVRRHQRKFTFLMRV